MSASLISGQGYYYGFNESVTLVKQGEPGYFFSQASSLATLSTNNEMGISGLPTSLWVPTLLQQDAGLCDNETLKIPEAVANQANMVLSLDMEQSPAQAPIGFAPWAVSVDCQFAYFRALANQSVQALITYAPSNLSVPPPITSGQWNLQDGDAWKGNVQFPVFAISGVEGARYMEALSATAQNSSLSNGVTYWVESQIDLQDSNSWAVLPDLWTIVLAVLAAFVAILAGVSGVLHLLQRKRRRDLRRRIMSGEVALEDIGIRKLTVPQALLDKMPVCKYSSLAGQDSLAGGVFAPEKAKGASPADVGPAMAHNYNQPTCAICLDDFASDSDVRCLPCDHVFHPECCDSFLLENSSLCPMCKKSVLPKGYCPEKITNAMVRRERLARMREAEERAEGDGTASSQPSSSWHMSAAARMRHALNGQNSSGRPLQPSRGGGGGDSTTAPQSLEMQPQPPAPSANLDSSSSVPISPAPATSNAPARGPAQECSPSRREWARRRALQLLGPQAQTDAVVEEESARQAQVPRWRRAVAKVFPSNPA